jgi:hypothetical protein
VAAAATAAHQHYRDYIVTTNNIYIFISDSILDYLLSLFNNT